VYGRPIVPTVLVTGASRGIGAATVGRLARAGWEVLGTVRGEADAEALRAGGVTPIVLDVTDAAQVAALPAAVPAKLDALVNNAGVVVGGPIEALDLDRLREQFEVNVVGQVAVTQALLPRLRESGGRIVFVSSVSGRVSTPLLGAYNASKFALEALADSLRVELRPWKMPVVLVEPGAVDTDIWRNAEQTMDDVLADLRPEHRTLYTSHTQTFRKAIPHIRKGAAGADKVAEAVERALTAARPRARYVVGLDARAQLAITQLAPTRLTDAAFGKMIGS
jgi:NAD(P)-dependent dehydrogenase (short-subunit alcohol dehydrogenase family)